MRRDTYICRLVLLALAIGSPLLARCQAQTPHDDAAPSETITPTTLPVSPLPVVLTTDCGVEIDDQWALAHLLLSPEIDLRAVITSHAASIGFSSATSAKKAAEVIERVLPASLAPPPVLPGSNAPLQDVTTPRQNAGVDKLLEISRGFSGSRRLVVLVIGAATDVASAILVDPSVVNRVSVVAMGYDDWPGGRDGFNVRNDPLAWRVLLDSDAPVVVGSGALTRRALRLSRTEAGALIRRHGPVGEYLYSLLDNFLTKQGWLAARLVAPETWVIWDEVVVAYALGMARGNEVPRPGLEPDLSFSHPETSRRITWLTDIDTDRFWLDLTKKMDARDHPRTRR
jgi:purine nucleosidase